VSAVNNIYSTNTAPAGYTAEGIVGNLSKVLKEIYPQKADNMVAQGMITEEQLFASFAFGEIEKKKPKLANTILGDLKEQFLALKKNGDVRPLFHAMEKAINNAVARGKLTSQEGSQIIKTSLGMAQLDNRNQWLSARRIKFDDQGTVPAGTTYMDRILSKVADNTAFSAQDLKAAESRMARLDATGATYAPLKKSAIEVVYSGKSETPKPETDVPTPVDDGSQVRFYSYEIGYKPKSSENGHAYVHIPAEYSANINLVEILNDAGEVVAAVAPSWQESHGARVARFSSPGSAFGSSFLIRVSYSENGRDPWSFRIEDSSKIFRRDP
jgi:hypothetical protein